MAFEGYARSFRAMHAASSQICTSQNDTMCHLGLHPMPHQWPVSVHELGRARRRASPRSTRLPGHSLLMKRTKRSAHPCFPGRPRAPLVRSRLRANPRRCGMLCSEWRTPLVHAPPLTAAVPAPGGTLRRELTPDEARRWPSYEQARAHLGRPVFTATSGRRSAPCLPMNARSGSRARRGHRCRATAPRTSNTDCTASGLAARNMACRAWRGPVQHGEHGPKHPRAGADATSAGAEPRASRSLPCRLTARSLSA
jgi:hypothetical protein